MKLNTRKKEEAWIYVKIYYYFDNTWTLFIQFRKPTFPFNVIRTLAINNYFVFLKYMYKKNLIRTLKQTVTLS